jgi:hypothetical protein
MACLRNLAIGALSRAGPTNLAAALRHHARDPTRSLATLGITIDRHQHRGHSRQRLQHSKPDSTDGFLVSGNLALVPGLVAPWK